MQDVLFLIPLMFPILLRNKLQCTTRTEHIFLLCPSFIYFWTATRVFYIYILKRKRGSILLHECQSRKNAITVLKVLVMFFPSGFPNTVNTLKPRNRDHLYVLFCRTWNYRISYSSCLGLFNPVLQRSKRQYKLSLQLKYKDAISICTKQISVACLFSDSVWAVDSRMQYTSGIIVKFIIMI